MEKTNIFVYNELSKLIANLGDDDQVWREALKTQAGYFNVINAKYFSDTLATEWENVASLLKNKGPELDSDGKIKSNAFLNTINQMSQQDCAKVVMRISALFEQVKKEISFDN